MNEEKLFPRVFTWLFVGLFISFLTGLFVSTQPNMIYNIAKNNLYLPIILVEVGLVIYLVARINKMSYMSAILSYLIYSFVSGLTLSLIFVAFGMASIVMVFGITSLIFLLFAAVGYFTNVDLTKIGTLAMMGLVGVILVSIINMFIGSNSINMITAILAIVIFIIFIAYDIQKIKRMAYNIDDPRKMAIIGAFQLYLDFINIFLRLLSIFGNRRN